MSQRVFSQAFVVVGAIIEKDGKILLVKENMKGPDNFKWNQPAGWVDVGENPINAVIREVKEETGLDFTPTALLGIYSLVRNDITSERGTPHALKLIFKGTVGGKPKEPNEEIAELQWFSLEEIDSMDNKTLRDLDIKQEAKNYFAGKAYPLEVIRHTMAKNK